jgi:hypothetical protein
MGLLDYIEDNWRDSYRPFTRYPKIYGEHFEQGIGLLAEEGQGWSSLYKKPLGLLNISAIPALYEAFRDEPIRNTLVNDLNIDPKKADYATQAIGLGMDVGAPYAVIRKGLTPWISEQVAKQANPSGFSPSRRRFLKGAGATAVGTATGIPMLKQVAKTVPDAFGSLLDKMSSGLDSIGVKDAVGTARGLDQSVTIDMGNFTRQFKDLAEHLVGMRRHREDMINARSGKFNVEEIKAWRKDHPIKDLFPYKAKNEALPGKVDAIRDRVKQEDAQIKYGRGHSPNRLHSGAVRFDHIDRMFGDVNVAKAHYDADPKGFILALENKIKVLKEGTRHRTAKMRSGELGPYEAKQLGWYTEDNASLVVKLEDFLKELKAGL